MGKTSKNQNYFLISAVILGNILTCFTKPYNYPDSLFKALFFTAICALHPSNPDVNARPIPWPINEDPDKDKQETTKAQEPSRGRRNWKTDNLSSVVAQQSGNCPSAPSREPQPHLRRKGGSCWEVGAWFRGFLWDQAVPTPSLWLQQRGQRLPTPRFHSKEECRDTEPVPGSGQPQARAPYLLEVTLRGFAGCRLAGDNAAPASAVLARIRLPEGVILQIKLETRPMQHKARPVLTTHLK